jgi:hypothetical protein
MSRRSSLALVTSMALTLVAVIGLERPSVLASAQATQSSSFDERITVKDGRCSIRVSNRSLVSILEHISTLQTDVTIVVKDRSIDRLVTTTLDAAPLDHALRALLDQEDLLMLYRPRGQGPSVLTAVIVWPKGQGDPVALSEYTQEAEDIEKLAAALDSADEAEREQAVQSLIDRFGTQSEDYVLRALNDASDRVREVALDGALAAAFELPVDILVRLAIGDPMPSIRMRAMEALGSNVEGVDGQTRLSTIGAVAGSDPDPSVRANAAKLFSQLTRERPRRRP